MDTAGRIVSSRIVNAANSEYRQTAEIRPRITGVSRGGLENQDRHHATRARRSGKVLRRSVFAPFGVTSATSAAPVVRKCASSDDDRCSRQSQTVRIHATRRGDALFGELTLASRSTGHSPREAICPALPQLDRITRLAAREIIAVADDHRRFPRVPA